MSKNTHNDSNDSAKKAAELTPEQIEEQKRMRDARRSAKRKTRQSVRAQMKALGIKLGAWRGGYARVKGFYKNVQPTSVALYKGRFVNLKGERVSTDAVAMGRHNGQLHRVAAAIRKH